MKRVLIPTLAAGCLLVASSVQAALNLVQDPGFEGGETGTLGLSSSPWSAAPNNDTTINTSHPHSGSFNAVLTSQTGESAILVQSLTLTAHIGYTIDFWAADPGESGGSLTVNLNGVTAGTVAIAPFSVYTQYNLTGVPVNSTGVLEFFWNTGTPPATIDIDDVSVAVPEPTTMVAGALMLLPFAASTFRRRKKV